MHKSTTCFWYLAVLVMASLGAFGQTTARLRTEQTSVEFQAQPASPQLVSLGTWTNEDREKLIDFVEIAGRPVKLDWKFNPQASRIDAHEIAFVYDCSTPALRLTWEWKAPASTGPVEHTVHIENLGGSEIWIPMQDSFEFNWRTSPKAALRHVYVEKGAGTPSADGTHETELSVGYHWTGTSSTYAHPKKDEPREVIPWFAVENPQSSQSGWYLGLEFSGRTRLTVERDSTSLHGVAGLNPVPGPFRTRLRPHERFDTPTVFLGAFSSGIDALGNVLRPWVRHVLTNPSAWKNPIYPLLVNNSWGSGMQVDETLAKRMIRDSAELGLEMFHIDAGWFRGVGDWYPDPKKFPHGLAPIADDAHRHGLKFGIWVDWTQAALDTEPGALNVRDPKVHDWTVSDLPPNWKPEPFKGQTIDIGLPAAHDYAQREVNRMVDDYHLDMLEHDGYLVAQGCVRDDHPHAPPDRARMSVLKDQGSYFVDSSN